MEDIVLERPVPGVPAAFIREMELLPEHLAHGVKIGPNTEAEPGALLFTMADIGSYFVRDGRAIEFVSPAGADRASMEMLLDSSARGALINQRGELALCAVTLMSPSMKCVAICGPSSFGKSTLAAILCRRGWKLMADDITRVTWNGNAIIAWPSADRIKLWRDACERLNMDFLKLDPVRAGMEAFYAPMPAMTTPAALSAIVGFRFSTQARTIRIPPDALASLIVDSTFQSRQIDSFGKRFEYNSLVNHLVRFSRGMILDGAKHCDVHELADCLSGALE